MTMFFNLPDAPDAPAFVLPGTDPLTVFGMLGFIAAQWGDGEVRRQAAQISGHPGEDSLQALIHLFKTACPGYGFHATEDGKLEFRRLSPVDRKQ